MNSVNSEEHSSSSSSHVNPTNNIIKHNNNHNSNLHNSKKRKEKSTEKLANKLHNHQNLNATLNKKNLESEEKQQIIEITEEELALFESIMSRELDANGGATVLAVSQKDLDEKLFLMPDSDNNNNNANVVTHEELLKKFSVYFLSNVYSEVNMPGGEEEEEESEDENGILQR